ncbi:4-hydroxy-tetrahydrodipicolinate reductase [Lactobacillus nasalidis]|uniref:4-hydroxy-tetrahydrodipicolinate reductase n=1 Tax=Lactobacillus nasalidis TaxID=2797258 RepID=A0ABQ3W8H8_9LACO|nr:4-hydroxy-tetrahydrodipicolinate reductase [Lactobacillus nasalidis]GHV97184.1 4-hydroxy-tetrahydrodipicolinate reductase [Lactobacillus nasalidis]GHV99386.1 4-hydroxy-tetrahydrodipicolinate reductase [Lactobacillus nasalidis]GHW01962.1 4-hydroxy-tetrahydrodipicolinate reductase [Lactobacillus nasalidis]
MTRVLLAGFAGSMGQQVVKLVKEMPSFEITAGLAHHLKSNDPAEYGLPAEAKLYTSLAEIPADAADVWIDFTVPASVYQNVRYALENGYRPIVGTTGLTDEQESELTELAKEKGLGGLIAPNFGMSAVLLMKFAQEAAKYFPDVEIIEMHHEDKKDAPSGTALATAKLIAEVRKPHQTAPEASESLPGARGGDYQGIKLHAVRLPGYVAHEQVLFGGKGEALTIRQDSFDRSSFMSGVKVALEKVQELDSLYVGLENIL